jgi:surface polysaccharide O-acyltransferase-like enzyme
MEHKIPCSNESGVKRYDLVVYLGTKIVLLISTKFICSNYNQNKNNYLEILVGESYLVKQCNPDVTILSFYVIPSVVKYNNQDKQVGRLEHISSSDFGSYAKLPIIDYSIVNIIDIDYDKNLIERVSCYGTMSLKNICQSFKK